MLEQKNRVELDSNETVKTESEQSRIELIGHRSEFPFRESPIAAVCPLSDTKNSRRVIVRHEQSITVSRTMLYSSISITRMHQIRPNEKTSRLIAFREQQLGHRVRTSR